MILRCFEYRKANYFSYVSRYYHQMLSLPLTHPEILVNLMNGEFSCQAIAGMCDAKESWQSAYQELKFQHTRRNHSKKKSVKTKVSTGIEIILKADSNLFPIMTIVAHLRQLDIK